MTFADQIPAKRGKHHCPAPGCSKPNAAKSLSVHPDTKGQAEGLFYSCHRCGLSGKLDQDHEPKQNKLAGCTVAQFAELTKLPVEFLRECGLVDYDWYGVNAVKIPYRNQDCQEVTCSYRVGVSGSSDQKFRRPTGHKVMLLGLDTFSTDADEAIMVEGETDQHTGRFHKINVIGLPGAGNWKESRDAAYFKNIQRIYIADEKDDGTAAIEKWLSKSSIRHKAYRLNLDGFKDLSALHRAEPDQFLSRLSEAKAKASLWISAEQKQSQTNVINAVDLLNLNLPELKTIVPGLLVVGLFFLVGKPKLGKSWLLLQIALAVALGGIALGSIPVEPAEVLYLALEDGRRRLKSRLKILLNGCQGKPNSLTFATSWRTLDAGGLEDLEDWLIAHPKTRLIVIDVFKRVRPAERANVGMYGQDYDAAAPIKDLAEKYDCCIVLCHHTRKSGSDDPLEMVSGSNGLNASADGTLVLRRERGQHDATLFVTGRDIQEAEVALSWDPAVTLWSVLGNASEFRVTPERAAILKVLKDSGCELSPKYIGESLGKSAGATRKLLWELSQQGLVSSPHYGKYIHNSNSSSSSNSGNSSNGSNSILGSVTSVTGCTGDRFEREGNYNMDGGFDPDWLDRQVN